MNYYEILGVNKVASFEEIKKSYRSLAIKWHPDTNPHETIKATEMFLKINEAYTVLRDADKRKQYDDSINPNSNSSFTNSNENPHQVFVDEMYRVAMELSFTNNEAKFIIENLLKIGCSQEIAATIADQSVTYRKNIVRQQAKKKLIISLSWLVGGTLVTIFSGIVIAWGAIIFGGYNFLVALYHLITGNTSSKNPYAKASKKSLFVKWSIISGSTIIILIFFSVIGQNENQNSTKKQNIYDENRVSLNYDLSVIQSLETSLKDKKIVMDQQKAELINMNIDIKQIEDANPNGIPEEKYNDYQDKISQYNILNQSYNNNINAYNNVLNDYSNKVDAYNEKINNIKNNSTKKTP